VGGTGSQGRSASGQRRPARSALQSCFRPSSCQKPLFHSCASCDSCIPVTTSRRGGVPGKVVLTEICVGTKPKSEPGCRTTACHTISDTCDFIPFACALMLHLCFFSGHGYLPAFLRHPCFSPLEHVNLRAQLRPWRFAARRLGLALRQWYPKYASRRLVPCSS
jgi:hypothetical protein